MEALYYGRVHLQVTANNRTGEQSYVLHADYPPEEALESLASRVRPLILNSEPIYYSTVFDALEEVIGANRLNEVIDVAWWRARWHDAIDGNATAQAYAVISDGGMVTDRTLMYAWLYGDVVHANTRKAPAVAALSIEDRFHAAAHGISRICERVLSTEMMLFHLAELGLITVAPAVLEQDVVVTNTALDRPVDARQAPLGTPLPDDLRDLDPTVWTRVHDWIAADRGDADGKNTTDE